MSKVWCGAVGLRCGGVAVRCVCVCVCVRAHARACVYVCDVMEIRHTMVWNIGIVILFLMMATAIIGYVLPWGQMSF